MMRSCIQDSKRCHIIIYVCVAPAGERRKGLFSAICFKQAVQPAHLALSVQHWCQSRGLTRIRLRNGRAFYYPYLLLLLLPFSVMQVLQKRSGVISFAFRGP